MGKLKVVIESKAGHTLYESWPVDQETADIRIVNGQAVCTKLIFNLGATILPDLACDYR